MESKEEKIGRISSQIFFSILFLSERRKKLFFYFFRPTFPYSGKQRRKIREFSSQKIFFSSFPLSEPGKKLFFYSFRPTFPYINTVLNIEKMIFHYKCTSHIKKTSI